MSNIQPDSGRQRPVANIIPLPVAHIAPDAPGGWFVVLGDFGWLYGSRREAVGAASELAREVRQ
jgi:hypothetical protein